MVNYFFTADEHYFHKNVLKYCSRPFDSVEQMNQKLIDNHNSIVGKNDVTIHIGDFTLANAKRAYEIINQLNGKHVFIEGSHDYWLKNKARQLWEKTINGERIVACHYAMRVWPRSHFNSWLCYGHSHGGLPPEGKSWDVGVDNNDYTPISFDQLKDIMSKRPDNFNFIKSRY